MRDAGRLLCFSRPPQEQPDPEAKLPEHIGNRQEREDGIQVLVNTRQPGTCGHQDGDYPQPTQRTGHGSGQNHQDAVGKAAQAQKRDSDRQTPVRGQHDDASDALQRDCLRTARGDEIFRERGQHKPRDVVNSKNHACRCEPECPQER